MGLLSLEIAPFIGEFLASWCQLRRVQRGTSPIFFCRYFMKVSTSEDEILFLNCLFFWFDECSQFPHLLPFSGSVPRIVVYFSVSTKL